MSDQSITRSRGWSIGNKMLAALVAGAVLPTVAVAVFAMQRTSEALVKQALYRLMDNTSAGARRAQDELRAFHQSVLDLRADPALTDVATALSPMVRLDVSGPPREDLDENMRELEGKLRTLFRKHPGCATVQLLMESGSGARFPVFRYERPEQTLERGFSIDVANKSIKMIGVRKGRLDESMNAALGPSFRNHPDREIQRVSVPSRADLHDSLEVMAIWVRSSDQTRVAWLVVGLSWTHILQDLALDAAARMEEEPLSVRVTLFDDDLRPLDSSPGDSPFRLPQEFEADARARIGGAALTADGEIVSFEPISPLDRYQEDFLILGFSRSLEVLKNLAQFRYVFSGVLVGALMLALALGTYLSRRLTQPLREVRDGARKIGKGDLDQTLEVPTGDEVEEVAEEFNSMARQLRSLYMGLEDTIRARTEQLQSALDDVRTAHRKLLESEARYSDIVENAFDLIQVTDEDGKLVSVNRRHAELMGRSLEELTGIDFLDLVTPEMRDSTEIAFKAVLQGETLRAHPSVLAVKGERQRVPVEISANPILREGRIKGVRAILRDVSERKEFESQLIKAERLSSVGALAAGVAHEINNPLGIITMHAQRTLEKAHAGEVDTNKLQMIIDQSKRLAKITTGLLDFSRSGPTEARPFSIVQVVDDTRALIQQRAKRSEIEIHTELPDAIPIVYGNPQQIQQVILNLLLNSLQAIGSKGRVDLIVETPTQGRLPRSQRAVRVTVADSGPGIAEDAVDRLFEPFFTTKSAGEGTGLGLSVSYGIIKDHNGRLWAANREEGGAQFQFELPIQESPGPSE